MKNLLMIRFFRCCLLAFAFSVLLHYGYCEGTRELRPDTLLSYAGLYIGSSGVDVYTQFGLINCPPNYRLYIHVKNPGESILFGLKSPVAYQFNLRKPDGTIALTGTCPVSPAQTGYIHYYHQAIVGPFPATGGYNPLVYSINNIADTGNYYFEIANLPDNNDLIFELWDFQVVSGAHIPPVPSDTINGRVWSQAWQVYTYLATNQVLNGRFFVYSDDGIITKLQYSNARVGAVTLFCNPYGCLNTGNFNSDRKSSNTNTFATFPGVAQYKVFLNNPDSTIYPSGTYGEITATPYMIADTNYPPCTGHKLIVVSVDKAGTVEVNITLPYGGPGSTVSIYSPVVPGINYIPWDGKDGYGNYVPDGTLITVSVRFVNGLTNLPIWDQETNPDGFVISLVRPVNPSVINPETYWDDSELYSTGMCPVSPQTVNLAGCLPGSMPPVPGCHPWGEGMEDCHNKTINTWWYGSSSTGQFTEIFNAAPIEASSQGSSRCGPGIDTLYASVPSWETVDWYDSITGGTLLLAGDTVFVTPFLGSSTTYYAEARAIWSGCLNPVRTPVTAIILENPLPSISGPDTICAGASGIIYSTEPGMTGYEWNISAGGNITSGSGTDSITVTWIIPGWQSVSVNYTGQNGCPGLNPATLPVGVVPFPGPAGPIRGPDTVCIPAQNVVYSVDPIPAAMVYIWAVPPGVIVTAGSGTNSIVVDFGADATAGNFIVYGVNPCGTGLPSPPYHVEVQKRPQANAGPGDTICQGHPFTVTGASASGYKSLHWITSGAGTFTGDSTLTPTYLPALYETGEVMLTLVATGIARCPDDSSALLLLILPAPEANAGPDLSSCAGEAVLIPGSQSDHYQSLLWTTSGTGTFNDPALLHPQYIPGPGDTLSGTVTLTLSVTGFAPCDPVSDSLMLSFAEKATVKAGPDTAVCGNQQVRLSGTFAENYTGLLWITPGDGTFDDPSLPDPRYTPGTGDILSGSVTLTIKAFAANPCLPDSDRLVLTIGKPPMVYAGPDGATCAGRSFALTGAAIQNFSSFRWEHTGQGIIQGGNTLSPTYVPAFGETGNVTITLVAYGTGVCSGNEVRDSLALVIFPQISVYAGPDQSITYGTSAGLNGTAAGGTGNYRYLWEPAGMVPDSTNPQALTVSLTADIILTLTVTDLSTGCINSDEIKISVSGANPEDECIVIYNVITPNGDGANDTWVIDCIENFPDNNVKIFNRWGDKVNEFEHYNNTTVVWKGTNFDGEKLPDGTYYYVVTIKDSGTRAGWVYIRAGSR